MEKEQYGDLRACDLVAPDVLNVLIGRVVAEEFMTPDERKAARAAERDRSDRARAAMSRFADAEQTRAFMRAASMPSFMSIDEANALRFVSMCTAAMHPKMASAFYKGAYGVPPAKTIQRTLRAHAKSAPYDARTWDMTTRRVRDLYVGAKASIGEQSVLVSDSARADTHGAPLDAVHQEIARAFPALASQKTADGDGDAAREWAHFFIVHRKMNAPIESLERLVYSLMGGATGISTRDSVSRLMDRLRQVQATDAHDFERTAHGIMERASAVARNEPLDIAAIKRF